jgi:hypothetical protein
VACAAKHRDACDFAVSKFKRRLGSRALRSACLQSRAAAAWGLTRGLTDSPAEPAMARYQPSACAAIATPFVERPNTTRPSSTRLDEACLTPPDRTSRVTRRTTVRAGWAYPSGPLPVADVDAPVTGTEGSALPPNLSRSPETARAPTCGCENRNVQIPLPRSPSRSGSTRMLQ